MSLKTIKDVFIRLQEILGVDGMQFSLKIEEKTLHSSLEDVLDDLKRGKVSWSLQDCRFGIKPLVMVAKMSNETKEISSLLLVILTEIVAQFSTQLNLDIKKSAQNQFILTLAESYCHFVVKTITNNQEFHEPCYRLLEFCKNLLIISRNTESLVHISSTLYNIAGILYKGYPQIALGFAESSESVYKDFLKNHDHKSDGWIQLVKKQDLLASIYLSLSNKTDGIRKWKQVIQSVPMGEWVNFSGDSSNSVLLKTIQRYVKAVLANDCEKYAPILELISSGSLTDEKQYCILDYELNTLIAMHDSVNTSKIQLPILERMQSLTFKCDVKVR